MNSIHSRFFILRSRQLLVSSAVVALLLSLTPSVWAKNVKSWTPVIIPPVILASPTPTPTPDEVLSATINDSVTGTGLNQFEYVGSDWHTSAVPNALGAYQNDEHYAFVTGTFAHFRFNGTQVKIYTLKEPAGGNIGYAIDGGAEQVVSNYAASSAGNQLSYTSAVLSSGNHDLVIRVVGSHEPSASSNTITVDKAEVYLPAVIQVLSATINDSVTGEGLNQFDYEGNPDWGTAAVPNALGAYQNDEHYAFVTDTFAHFRFNGTQVKIYTLKEPAGGNIGYAIDGGAEQVVSNYAASSAGNQLSYTSPVLSSGDHDLIIRVVGSHEPSASSNTITVDKAEVYVPAGSPVLSATINDSVTGTGLNQFEYVGSNWQTTAVGNAIGAYQNDEHYAFVTGTLAHFRFNGTQVKIYTVKEPAGGNIGYSIDGGGEQVVSNYAASTAGNQLSYTSPVLSSGAHDLVIREVGSHEPAASSNTITVDKAEVYVPVGTATPTPTPTPTATATATATIPTPTPTPTPVLLATINDSVTGTGLNQFEYVGSNWHATAVSNALGAYQNDEHYAFVTGTLAHFRFNGTQVKIYTLKEPAGGNIGYAIDGGAEQVVSNYAASSAGNQLSYTSAVLSSGNHDLVIRVVGSHEPSASSNTITVDKAEVYGPTATPIPTATPTPTPQVLSATINDSVTGTGLNQFEYVGSDWHATAVGNALGAYQDDEHYAFVTGTLAHFRFNGTQVKIYTLKEPAGGNIGYAIDGGAEQVVSNYAASIAGNQLSYTSPVLSSGDHDLVIRVVGSHEPAASSNTITVDKAEVYVPAGSQVLSARSNDSVTGEGLYQFDYEDNPDWGTAAVPNALGAYQNDEHYASVTNTFARFRFNGTQVKIYTLKEPAGGNIGYAIDGGAEQVVSNYAASSAGNQLSYTSAILSSGDHELVIRVVGSHEPAASSNTITVDKAEVYVPVGSQVLLARSNDSVTGEENNQFDYEDNPNWGTAAVPNALGAYQNDEHYASVTDTFARFRFNGTQVKIYTLKEPAGGNIGYAIDGGAEQVVSNYAPSSAGNQLSYTSPVLFSADHDLVIRVVGSHEPAASSNTITVDKAEVFAQ